MHSNFDVQTVIDTPVPLTSGVVTTIASLELPEGAWNMSAMVFFDVEPDRAIASISSQSDEIDNTFAREADGLTIPIPSPVPPDPFKKIGPTTVYLTVVSSFVGHCSVRSILKAHRAISW